MLSVGSANATAGVFATAAPMPSATANAPTRPMYCALTGIALSGQPAWAPAERPPEPPSSARWDPAAVKVILATFLADAVGLRCGLLMAVSSLYAPTRSAVGFGLERLPGRRLFPGGNVAGFTPRGRKRLQGPISVDQLGPPPPSTVFVGVPAHWMKFGSKGREGPPLGYIWRTWDTTLMCDADHVICCEINVSRVRQTLDCLQNPTPR